MKNAKLSVSKIGAGSFSLNAKKTTFDEALAGYPAFQPTLPQNCDVEHASALELEQCLKVLLYSDEHPPKDSPNGTNIYFSIVFESREQKDKFLKDLDLFRISDKYLWGEEFAAATGINLKTGTRKKITEKKSSFGNFGVGFSFGSNTNFSFGAKPKEELSEAAKANKARTKELARYIDWIVDSEYFFCLSFHTEKEKSNCLKALGLELEYGGKYLWCHDVAKVLGMELIPCEFKEKNTYKQGTNKRMEDMAFKIHEL